MEDQIQINAIRVDTFIGVPDEERANPQTIEVDLTIVPTRGFDQLDDEISATVDYYAVWKQVHEVAKKRPRKLIETLAEEIAQQLLADSSGIRQLQVVVRKFILPNTKSVEVSIERGR